MGPDVVGVIAVVAFLVVGWLFVVTAGPSDTDDDDWWDYR